jgi:hypothetical protein
MVTEEVGGGGVGEMTVEPDPDLYVSWGFSLLHRQVFESSLMDLPPTTRLLFHYLATDAGRGHQVWMPRGAMSRKFNIPPEEVDAGLEVLSSPDPYGRDQPYEGRRIMRMEKEGKEGWLVLNAEKYSVASLKWRRIRDARNSKAYRDRKRARGSGPSSGSGGTGPPP